MMMVDDGGGRGVKNGRKSDDVINGRPLRNLNNGFTNATPKSQSKYFVLLPLKSL